MAGSKAVWGIDLGQCALKAIKVTYDAKLDKSVAVAYDYIEHPKILSQPDADPDEMIRSALEQFLSRNSVKDDIVYISVPGQAGLARFVKLPPVEAKKIPDIVLFEARQQIPFPLDDVVWDFQKIGGGEEEEEGLTLDAEVGIFAIKKDAVQRTLAPYQRMGIDVEAVQLAPLALYNFAAFDYFYHGQKAKAAAAGADGQPGGISDEQDAEGDAAVLLDIGADKTDVVITDGDSIWLRNLPIGGNHFTRALTKDLKLTFAKAEHLKRNATKAPDPKKLYQAMRPVFQDFSNELQRSIGYYTSTHRGQTIKKIIGVGNGFKLPGLQKFLQQNLSYDVERIIEFKGMAGDEVLAQPVFSDNMPGFAVAYGLALQGLHQTPIQTNLLPREVRVEKLIRAKKPWSLTAAAALLFGFFAVYLGYWRVYNAVGSEAFNGPKSQAEQAKKSIDDYAAKFNDAKNKFNATKTGGETLLGAERLNNRLGWIKICQLINNELPPRDPNLKPETELDKVQEINVEALDAGFMANTGEWFSGIDDTHKNTMDEKEKAAGPDGEGWVFQILGYTFHEDQENYIVEQVLPRFQRSKALRDAGCTHFVLIRAEPDFAWTPAKGSSIKTWPRMSDSNSNANAAGGANPGQTGGMRMGGRDDDVQGATGSTGTAMRGLGGMGGRRGRNDDDDDSRIQGLSGGGGPAAGTLGGGMRLGGGRGDEESGMGDGGMPGDFASYYQNSIKRAEQAEPAVLLRTDFQIQFVWRPSVAAAAAAAAAGNAPAADPVAK